MTEASDWQITRLLHVLERAKERPRSANFLDGFPWSSVRWYFATGVDMRNLYLFWDGTAWGEPPEKPPRTVAAGVRDFEAIVGKILDAESTYYERLIDHLNEILKSLNGYRKNPPQKSDDFLILADSGAKTPTLIIDGNHRAAAAVWWLNKYGKGGQLLTRAWLARSRDMKNYPYYRRIYSWNATAQA